MKAMCMPNKKFIVVVVVVVILRLPCTPLPFSTQIKILSLNLNS